MIEKIENLTFPVSDLKKAIAFYENILGLKKRSEWSNYATFNIGEMMLGLDPDPKAELQIYMRVANMDDEYENLKQKGANFITEPKDQYWGGRTAMFKDPDGNKFVIESFECKVCGKTCKSYRELLEEHLRKHRREQASPT